MLSLSRPEVILTHESDLDGLVSGMLLRRLARKLFDATVPLEAFHYNLWRGREPREAAAWVCDFTFEARLDKPNWVVIDHHPTELVPRHATLLHDVNASAGTLCYQLCREHGLAAAALDRIVHLNNVADLFLVEDPDFMLANDYANLVKVYGFWTVHTLLEGDLERILDHPLLEVMAVKRRLEDPIGFEWSRRNIVEITPTIGFVDTILGNTNLIVHQLLQDKATPYPVLLTLFRRANGVVIASLRSRGGEALPLAERLQGGGHPNACGATLPRSVRSVPDAIAYLQRVLNPTARPAVPSPTLEGLFAAWEDR